jgi:hypothetical protein
MARAALAPSRSPLAAGRMAVFALVAALGVPWLSAPVAVAVDLVPTSILLEAPTAVELGEPLTLTATVSPDPDGGWITFFVDGTPELTTQVPSGGVISFTFEDGLSYYGQHAVAAQYLGNDTHNGSYDSALVDVPDDRTPVTVSLTSSPNPAMRGEPITFSVSVSPNPHGGEIELRHGGSPLAVGSLGGNGQATLETSFGVSGSIDIEACFLGNDSHQRACSAPLDQVVRGITSTTTLTIEAATVYPDESITVGVTVSPAPETATTVWVGTSPFDNRIPVGVSGPAGYGETTLTSGVVNSYFVLGALYDLRAYFPGTAQLEPSTSNLVQFQVRLDEATLVTSIDPGEHHVGDPLTFSASVSPLPIIEEAGVGFMVMGPASSGFGDNIGVELGLDGTGQTTVDTDGWPAGDYWYEAACCGDPHLAPTKQRGEFTLLDEDAPAGDLSVADGASTVVSAGVEADVPATDGVGSGVQVVALSNDGSTWTSMPYEASVEWSLSGGDGAHTVRAKWRDQAGNWSPIRSDTVILDTHGPTGSVSIAGGAATTRTPAVTVAAPANDATTGLSQVALSNNGTTWTTRTYASSQAWTLTGGEGNKTVHVKWKDAAGNWSAPKSDTILLDSVAPGGTVAIASGATYATNTVVTIATAATDPGSGLSQVALSNDGVSWTTRAYAASQAWTLSSSNGTKTVWVKWKDVAGNWSAAKTDTIVLDTVAPTVTAPRRGLVAGTAISSGKVTLRVPWTGADATSGIARYDFAQSTGGGPWTTISTTLTSPTIDRSLTPLHSYRFGVRAIDKAGNVGPWAIGSTFRLSRYSEFNSAIRYSGSWSTVSSAAYWGGAAKRSGTAGARATLTFTGRTVAWVARTGPNRGLATVYVNGTKVATLDLYSATYRNQRVVWARNWSTSATRTVTIRVAGTSGRPLVDVDAFVTTN